MQGRDSEIIFRYANGEEIDEDQKAEIERHLRESDSYRKEYEFHVAMRKLLTEHWDGKIVGCFDTDTLSEYLEGWVDDDVKAQIEAHISHCQVCASELEMMKQMEVAPESSGVDTEIPGDVDRRILGAIMAKREELLAASPVLQEVAKQLTERFIAKYHESEQSMVEGFWQILSPLYNREARFGSTAFGPGVSAAVGDAKDAHTPSIIFTMMGICDHLQELDEMPDEKALKEIIRQKAKRFDISWRERRKLEEFLTQEFVKE